MWSASAYCGMSGDLNRNCWASSEKKVLDKRGSQMKHDKTGQWQSYVSIMTCQKHSKFHVLFKLLLFFFLQGWVKL